MNVEGASNWMGAMALVTTLAAMVAVAKPYDEYPEWELLPKGIDMDENDDNAFRALVNQGESVYDAMLAVIWECDEIIPATTALAVLEESKGDKSQVFGELRRFLSARLPLAVGDTERICLAVAKVLAKNGSEEDIAVLIPMLAHPSDQLRYVGAMCLGQCGNQAALEKLEAARVQSQPAWVMQGIETAIARIEERLAKDPGSLGQGKSDAGETEVEEIVEQRSAIGGSMDGRD